MVVVAGQREIEFRVDLESDGMPVKVMAAFGALPAALAQELESLPEDWLSTDGPVERQVHVGFLALRPVADGRWSQLVAPWPWDAWPSLGDW